MLEPRVAAPLVLALALSAAAAAAGCSGEIGGAAPSGGTTGTPPPPPTGAELFAAMEPDLVAACGSCHDAGGFADTPFLAGPDRYGSVVSWPGIVVKDWERSTFLTHAVAGGGHGGTNLDSEGLADTLLPDVREWLEVEAADLPDIPDGPPTIPPFAPINGFNAVYLDELGPDFEGIAITFSAKTPTPDRLELTSIEVHPTKTKGVRMVHPVLSVFAKGAAAGEPDPADTFAGLDASYAPGAAGPLGPGAATLTTWSDGARLAVVFDVLEPYGGQGGAQTCSNVAGFTANAQALFQGSCATCHAGGNAQAAAAVDMSALATDPAAACAQIRSRVSPADPPSSQIFINTDPGGNAAHPFKFNGDAAAFDAFRDGASVWIATEL
ncbi:MAG: hypothetical protein IT372_20275 [Polyangiaceae bacterium]|nr:hypothetical protein [Polyangiaceae bacterium]